MIAKVLSAIFFSRYNFSALPLCWWSLPYLEINLHSENHYFDMDDEGARCWARSLLDIFWFVQEEALRTVGFSISFECLTSPDSSHLFITAWVAYLECPVNWVPFESDLPDTKLWFNDDLCQSNPVIFNIWPRMIWYELTQVQDVYVMFNTKSIQMELN